MTVGIKAHKDNGYYVSLYWDKSNVYVVEVCPVIDDNMCGYPERKMVYAINEKNMAETTYRRYVKTYCGTKVG